jgi:septum formation inhibitor-activating ATPase MinD
MLKEVEQLIKMAKIAVGRIDNRLVDVTPLIQAINDAERVLDDVEAYDELREAFEKAKSLAPVTDVSMGRD